MMMPWTPVMVLLAAALWKLFCVLLRMRCARRLLCKAAANPHAINASTMSLEFPFLFLRSIEIATFRTFAIPSISATLRKGGQYARNASKRYDDTEILIDEMLLHHIDSYRGSLALRRLNFLHSHYAINNADFLYVLCLAMLLPPEWCARYGYREWSTLEISSYFKAWHDIATRMGIRDIPPSIEAAAQYRDGYEAKHMTYADSNHEISELNMKLFLSELPALLWPLARRLLYALLDDPMRVALGYPKQPTWLSFLAHCALKLHGIFVGWMPPRPLSWAQMRVSIGCPAINNPDTTERVLPLAFQRYKPVTYQDGYKISDLGAHQSGKLGPAFYGDLLCPALRLPEPPLLSLPVSQIFSSMVSKDF